MQFMTNMAPALTVFVNLGVVAVIWAGGLGAIRGDLTVGQIVAFTNYLLTTMTPLILMTLLSQVWAAGVASARRVDEILQTIPEVQDLPEAQPLPEAARGRVVFESVSFHYNSDHAEPVLVGVDLTAEPGQTIAILGATGAGKTTLVNLLTRFYEVGSGRISIDGRDIRRIRKADLRQKLGLVFQDTFLFSGTVMDNIRYGRLEASDAEVVEAARMAEADPFIRQLPEGYQTDLSERAANLSQGQRQLLSIARAILADPGILVLDEATSSVDTRTEARIQAALLRLMRGRTSFVIAHRLSTIRDADQVLVIRAGEIVERGTHEQLMERRGFFHHLYLSQFKGQAI
jgi:ATP-binding cassette subfamily B protein